MHLLFLSSNRFEKGYEPSLQATVEGDVQLAPSTCRTPAWHVNVADIVHGVKPRIQVEELGLVKLVQVVQVRFVSFRLSSRIKISMLN